MSVLALIGLLVWIALVFLLAWEEANREEPTRELRAFYARQAQQQERARQEKAA